MKLILKNLEMNIEEKKYLGKQFVCYHCYHYKKKKPRLISKNRLMWSYVEKVLDCETVKI